MIHSMYARLGICLSKSIVRSHHQKNVFEISWTLCTVLATYFHTARNERIATHYSYTTECILVQESSNPQNMYTYTQPPHWTVIVLYLQFPSISLSKELGLCCHGNRGLLDLQKRFTILTL